MTQPTPPTNQARAVPGHVIVPVSEYERLTAVAEVARISRETRLINAARAWREMWRFDVPWPSGRVEALTVALIDAVDALDAEAAP